MSKHVFGFFTNFSLFLCGFCEAVYIVEKVLCGGREGAEEEARVEACWFSEIYCFSFSQLTLSRSGHIKYLVFTEKYFTG